MKYSDLKADEHLEEMLHFEPTRAKITNIFCFDVRIVFGIIESLIHLFSIPAVPRHFSVLSAHIKCSSGHSGNLWQIHVAVRDKRF